VVFAEGRPGYRRFVQPAYIAAGHSSARNRAPQLLPARCQGKKQVSFRVRSAPKLVRDASLIGSPRTPLLNQATVAGFKEGLNGGGHRIFYRRKTVNCRCYQHCRPAWELSRMAALKARH
jgi:hypothetical protein